MKASFKIPLLSLSILLAMHVSAEDLDTILIEDTVNINPNTASAEDNGRTRATSADGGDFLKQVNGMSVSRFGGRGLEPILRGQSQTRLNVLLDGAYIHGGCPNRMDPPTSWAALETYENVIVQKGVQTLVNGGGGSGGTVLFERDTRELAEETGIHGRISTMGSHNGIEHDVIADVVASTEKGYVRGISEIKKNGNYDDGNGTEVRSSFDHKQAGLIFGYTPTEDRLFELSVEKNRFRDALYPGAGMDSPEEDSDIVRLRYLDKPANSSIDSIKVEAYLSDVDHLMDNYSLRPNTGMQLATPTTSKTVGGRLVLQSTARKTLIEYGIDMQNNDRDAQLQNDGAGGRSISLMWPDISIEQTGLFAEATTRLDQKQRIKYGARVDLVDTSSSKADVAAQVTGRTANQSYLHYYGTTDTDQDEANVGGLLRYEKDLANDLSLFTGISRSVRTADSTERGMNKWVTDPTLRWVGNPTIKPEKHHQFDVGLSKSTDRLYWSGTVFFDEVSDYILRDSATGQDGILQADGATIYRNVDAQLYGAEVESTITLNNAFKLSGALAYVHATNTSDDRAIAQTPPLNGKVQLDYKQDKWDVGTRINFASKQNRIDDLSPVEVGETAGYGTLNLYGRYQVQKNTNLRLGIDNVLDKSYAEHASRSNSFDPTVVKVNEPGRTVWAKLTVDF
ncbi:MAG: Outer membrane receptor proteins, mostly Fe transport [uncultured Thiotrichaceae bacterium]|uniref:Outer membrane receptor proteins, mostly Fe transport n=1 Tax=uncultured Thiotrichaceae bacterium TaxID=298394 RepID=A0A6S6UIE5_9GAMM|nr:MAG: Outer membrane receptor proteins, mostly Fe transport [uncultured Thiotrichaceae bacterium]